MRVHRKRIQDGVKAGLGSVLAALLLVSCANRPAIKGEEMDRMAWWREAKFGMFIHWGLYALPAGTWKGERIPGIGEWIMHRARIPVKEYAALAGGFNPVKFDAREWVRLAKAAGMRYMVITSKHHDGFAMFKSRASGFNIHDATPFKRDPLRELADACREEGLPLGFYYSQAQDWHHAGGAAAGGHWDKAQDGDMDAYIREVAAPQVREILGNYGRVAILWWDTPVDMNEERALMLKPLLDLQPGIITNNRLGGGIPGDTETPEQHIPVRGFPGRDWETCMTMNDTWGYKSYDENWKSVQTLLRNLADIASKGGNYLLNVGPTAEGEIPRESVERLIAVGEWLKLHGEAIYGTQATPLGRLPWGRCTRKGNTLYLHVFDWPSGGVLSVPLKGRALGARLLGQREVALEFEQREETVEIRIPQNPPDRFLSVVALEVKGKVEAVVSPVAQDAGGVIRLTAEDAEIVGTSARLEGHPELNVGYWTAAEDHLVWRARIDRPGKFRVRALIACEPDSAGSEFEFSGSGQAIRGTVQATESWRDYREISLGETAIGKRGSVSFTLKPVSKPGMAVMNLRWIELVPEKE